jgi:DNA-binding NtrC family response regulator
LALKFLAQASEAHGHLHPPSLSFEALQALQRHAWPGNIRELRNVIERAVVLCTGEVVTSEHLPSAQQRPPNVVHLASHARPTPGEARGPDPSTMTDKARAERQRIEEALDLCAGNQSRAAKMLGISRATLVARLDLYGFPRPRKRAG